MNKVIYKDVAVGSKANPPKIKASTSLMSNTAPSNVFKDVIPDNYVTFENNGFDLTRTDQIFAVSLTSVGLISAGISDANRAVSCSFTAIAQNSAYFSSPGVTITFWQNYCTNGTIVFKNGSATVASTSFTCSQLVNYIACPAENYNTIVFTFTKTELPYQFVKIASIDLGREVVLTDLYNLNLLEEINLTGEDLSINTLDFSCETDEDLDIKEDQLFYAYNGDTMIGKFNMDDASEDTFTKYTISGSDDITLLDKIYFTGGVYYPGDTYTYTVYTMIEKIKTLTGLNIEYDSGYRMMTLKGWIPYCTCRKALMLIAFAIGAVVHVKRNGTIYLIPFNENQTPKTIPGTRILGTAKYSKGDIYTGVELYRYDYLYASDSAQTVYETGDTALASPITIYFDKPIKSYEQTGTVSYAPHVNYIVINSMAANSSLRGYPFSETKTILSRNSNKYNTSSNIKSFSNYTLYTDDFDKLSQLYKHTVEYVGTVEAKIVLDGEQVGDIVSIPTKYSGTKIGVITSLDSNVNNKLVAKAVIQCLG